VALTEYQNPEVILSALWVNQKENGQYSWERRLVPQGMSPAMDTKPHQEVQSLIIPSRINPIDQHNSPYLSLATHLFSARPMVYGGGIEFKGWQNQRHTSERWAGLLARILLAVGYRNTRIPVPENLKTDGKSPEALNIFNAYCKFWSCTPNEVFFEEFYNHFFSRDFQKYVIADHIYFESADPATDRLYERGYLLSGTQQSLEEDPDLKGRRITVTKTTRLQFETQSEKRMMRLLGPKGVEIIRILPPAFPNPFGIAYGCAGFLYRFPTLTERMLD
jgi:hypothetical protein